MTLEVLEDDTLCVALPAELNDGDKDTLTVVEVVNVAVGDDDPVATGAIETDGDGKLLAEDEDVVVEAAVAVGDVLAVLILLVLVLDAIGVSVVALETIVDPVGDAEVETLWRTDGDPVKVLLTAPVPVTVPVAEAVVEAAADDDMVDVTEGLTDVLIVVVILAVGVVEALIVLLLDKVAVTVINPVPVAVADPDGTADTEYVHVALAVPVEEAVVVDDDDGVDETYAVEVVVIVLAVVVETDDVTDGDTVAVLVKTTDADDFDVALVDVVKVAVKETD